MNKLKKEQAELDKEKDEFSNLKHKTTLTLAHAKKCIIENNSYKIKLTHPKTKNRGLLLEKVELRSEIEKSKLNI